MTEIHTAVWSLGIEVGQALDTGPFVAYAHPK